MVVSSPITGAAIIGGELILSLPTGEIINCGLVQGPPGPKGAVGAPGPKGDPGLDPNTLLHGTGFPDPGLGKSGDFYWMVSPEVGVFGPKTGAGWGSPVILSRPIVASKAENRPIFGQGGGGSGGQGGRRTTTYGSKFPSKPSTGDQHVMDDTLYEYVYTGGEWMQIVSPGGGGGGGGATTLGALLDVTLTGTQEGEVLAANGSGTWVNSQNIDGGTF